MEWNKEQWEAITHQGGPVLVAAGPGSGKTAVIVNHIKYLLDQGVPGETILVLTFTRAAAIEMSERFRQLVPDETAVTFGTFHSVCFQILKEECGYCQEDLLTEEDKRRLLKELLFQHGMLQANAEAQIERMLREIERRKGRGKNDDVAEESDVSRIFAIYQAELKRRHRLDFQDMLEECYDLFLKNEKIRKKWKQRFQYLLVDEYQDLNALQTAWVRLLVGQKGHVFAVGDEDQSIYRFRGADPSEMLHFETQYPGARKILLTKNYRTLPEILKYAEKLIQNNQERFAKKIEAVRKEQDNVVKVTCYEDEQAESDGIVQEMIRLHKEGHPFSDMAVLYRSMTSARRVIRALSDRQIPFVCKEIPKEYQGEWAVEDMKSYLRLAQSRRWRRSDLLRILNRPERGLPRTGLQDEWIEPRQWLQQFDGVQGYEEKARELYRDIQRIGKMDRYAFVTYLWKGVGYDVFVKEFCRKREISETKIQAQVAAWRDEKSQEEKREQEGAFIVTMHASKGLEFPIVFLPECNEGAVPHSRACSKQDVEEERRLMYVAMTRAKDLLYLSWVKRRFHHHPPASRFLKEMGLIEAER